MGTKINLDDVKKEIIKHETGFEYDYTPRVVSNLVQSVIMTHHNIPCGEFHNAIGYLTQWASHADMYKYAVIRNDRMDGDLIACYWASKEDADNGIRPRFVMGAVYNKKSQTYSFHS